MGYELYTPEHITVITDAWGANCAINIERFAVEKAISKFTEIPF